MRDRDLSSKGYESTVETAESRYHIPMGRRRYHRGAPELTTDLVALTHSDSERGQYMDDRTRQATSIVPIVSALLFRSDRVWAREITIGQDATSRASANDRQSARKAGGAVGGGCSAGGQHRCAGKSSKSITFWHSARYRGRCRAAHRLRL